jgi:hypothetical protein
MLRNAASKGEQRDQHAHDDRATDIFKQSRVGKRRAQQPREGQIEAVTQRRANAAANKYDDITHGRLFSRFPGQ